MPSPSLLRPHLGLLRSSIRSGSNDVGVASRDHVRIGDGACASSPAPFGRGMRCHVRWPPLPRDAQQRGKLRGVVWRFRVRVGWVQHVRLLRRPGVASERRTLSSSSSSPSGDATTRGPRERSHASTQPREASQRRPMRTAPDTSPRRHAAMIVRFGPGTTAHTSTRPLSSRWADSSSRRYGRRATASARMAVEKSLVRASWLLPPHASAAGAPPSRTIAPFCLAPGSSLAAPLAPVNPGLTVATALLMARVGGAQQPCVARPLTVSRRSQTGRRCSLGPRCARSARGR
jgi:hypothetical protein